MARLGDIDESGSVTHTNDDVVSVGIGVGPAPYVVHTDAAAAADHVGWQEGDHVNVVTQERTGFAVDAGDAFTDNRIKAACPRQNFRAVPANVVAFHDYRSAGTVVVAGNTGDNYVSFCGNRSGKNRELSKVGGAELGR